MVAPKEGGIGGVEPPTVNFDNTACFLYLDIQIYTLEMETYLVDSKCAGYEAVVGSCEVPWILEVKNAMPKLPSFKSLTFFF